MSREKWAETLQREAYEKWKNKYSSHKAGFKVFFSPIRENPDIMIISYNPGDVVIHLKVVLI